MRLGNLIKDKEERSVIGKAGIENKIREIKGKSGRPGTACKSQRSGQRWQELKPS